MAYNFKEIEKKWQNKWEKEGTFNASTDYTKKKWYGLIEFPYPSGQGLHVGHPRSYTALDIIARKRRLQGYNVLFPIGFDAFGLPAENYAIKTNVHPKITTAKNIAHFTEQLKSVGFSFDWSRVIDTTDPEYYKWTQWIFIQLYKHGLAYKATMPINFCTGCKVGLANEEVVNGVCERCGSPVVQKEKSQWMLRITKYAQRLIDDLDDVDYLEKIKTQQRNWIGRSEGAEVKFKIAGTDETLTVYTTRPDTLFGATYMVVAPEHKLIEEFASKITNLDEIKEYQKQAALKSDFERGEMNKDKTGVEIKGIKAINPLTNKEIPIWVADYVLSSYGTGAIMAVPAHDTRDYEFATKFGLNIIPVLEGGDVSKEAFTGDGVHINSGFLNGLGLEEAKNKVIKYLEDNKIGERKINYKLRDWVFSRQRYWGEPIPMVYCDDCGWVPVDEKDLPLTLPDVKDFLPGEDGESPLARHTEWINTTCPHCGKPAKRETDTMPQWAGSCWYYIRYIDPHNSEQICDPKLLDKWLPVDLYVGGAEHAVLHLLYSRFWHKVLYDCGVVKCKEPWQRLVHQGMILGDNNEKMSKSRGNVVNPDDIVASHGADSLRLYEMFMGPLEASLPWSTNGLDGSRKWLDRVYRLMIETGKLSDENDHSLDRVYHQTVKKVTDDFEKLGFNTAISQMMIFINECYKAEHVYKEYAENFIKMLSCIAPHICEEMWQQLGHNDSIAYELWPTYDEKMLVSDTVQMGIQVNGKLRAKIEVAKDADDEAVKELAFQQENVKAHTDGKNIVKVIVVKNKIVNIVVK